MNQKLRVTDEPKTHVIRVRLNDELNGIMWAYCISKQMTISHFVRLAIKEYVTRHTRIDV